MQIVFYKSLAEINRVDKTDYLTEVFTMNGTLKSSTSLLQPIIDISTSYNDLNIGNDNDQTVVDDDNQLVTVDGIDVLMYREVPSLFNVNYCYIPDFNRYYFVQNITSVAIDLWRVSLKVDVLMTYKNVIKTLNAYVTRNEFDFDAYIQDNLLGSTEKYIVTEENANYTPPVDSLKNIDFISDSDNNICRNIMLVAFTDTPLSDSSKRSKPSYMVLNDIITDVNNTFSGTTDAYNYYSLDDGDLFRIINHFIDNDIHLTVGGDGFAKLNGLDEIASFILNIVAYPFELPHTQLLNDIYIGTSSVECLNQAGVVDKMSPYLIPSEILIEPTYNDFRDYLCKYELYFPFVGWVEFPAYQVLNKRLIPIYVTDYITNDGLFQLVDYTDFTNPILIYSCNVTLGVQISLATSNIAQYNRQKIANQIQAITSLTTTAISGGIAMGSGNPYVSLNATRSASRSIGDVANNYLSNYQKGSVNLQSNNQAINSCKKVRYRVTKPIFTEYNNNFFHLNGRPLNQNRVLGNISGYTVVGDVHIENEEGTITENQEIETLLKGGVIL